MATSRRVGFWSDCSGVDGLPRPQDMVDSTWSRVERDAVVAYLRAGRVKARYRGYAACRFRCRANSGSLGSCDMTDGTYVWPQGLPHYLERHDVKPPEEFVRHVLAGGRHAASPIDRLVQETHRPKDVREGVCVCPACVPASPGVTVVTVDGLCATCQMWCAPMPGGGVRSPTMSAFVHAPPEARATALEIVGGVARGLGALLTRAAKEVRQQGTSTGLSPARANPRNAKRRRST